MIVHFVKQKVSFLVSNELIFIAFPASSCQFLGFCDENFQNSTILKI
ncbi:Protein CBG27115 [Caenorhabditis briggsae]|uniref:Protein CBG27115 n=1 Tax=Caenorhabditis briggsae TaxID=6238 RepID=B6IHI9_CAEBR|nr:Protein CBG27115 [Caenorhabditis briggsae]CAR99369.1 Protein CBG27115 [Caenorhabditis briggsae]